jgi:hypothetical protein
MEFEVTDHALAGYQAINLTNNLNAAIAASMEVEQEMKAEEERAAAEAREIEESVIKVKEYKTPDGKIYYLAPESSSKRTERVREGSGLVRTAARLASSISESSVAILRPINIGVDILDSRNTTTLYYLNDKQISKEDYERVRLVFRRRDKFVFRITLRDTEITSEEYEALKTVDIKVIQSGEETTGGSIEMTTATPVTASPAAGG